MTTNPGFPGGIGYDPDSCRGGTDWNRDGSIDYADGAHNMLVQEYVRTDGTFSDSSDSNDAAIQLPFFSKKAKTQKTKDPNQPPTFKDKHPYLHAFLFGCGIGTILGLVIGLIYAIVKLSIF